MIPLPAAGEDFFVAVTEGHHDQHRLRFPSGDEIIENHVRAAHIDPGIFGVTEAMQEVKHRVGSPCRRIVAGRGVNQELAFITDALRLEVMAVNHAVRYVVDFPGERGRAGYMNLALGIQISCI